MVYWVVLTLNCIPILAFFSWRFHQWRCDQAEEKSIKPGTTAAFQNSHSTAWFDGEFRSRNQLRYDFSKDNELSQTLNRSETRHQLQFGNIREMQPGFLFAEQNELYPRKWTIEPGLRLENKRYSDHLNPGFVREWQLNECGPKLSLFYQAEKPAMVFEAVWGFHSNDTGWWQQNGKMIALAAYGGDLGLIRKPRTWCGHYQTAHGNCGMDQEFVYVGDAGELNLKGKTGRLVFDLSARTSWHFEIVLPIWTWTLQGPRASFYITVQNHTFTRSWWSLQWEDWIYQMPKAYPPSLGGIATWVIGLPMKTNEVIATGYTVFDLLMYISQGCIEPKSTTFSTRGGKKLN